MDRFRDLNFFSSADDSSPWSSFSCCNLASSPLSCNASHEHELPSPIYYSGAEELTTVYGKDRTIEPEARCLTK
jgi:hypothetical protein